MIPSRLTSLLVGLALPAAADIPARVAALEAGDAEAAAGEFQAAFDAGEADGAFYLGRMFELGLGAEPNVAQSAQLYSDMAMISDETSFLFRPCSDLADLVARSWPVLERTIRTLGLSGVFYSGGGSRKDALTRPRSLASLLDFNTEAKRLSRAFASRLVFRESYWTTEYDGLFLTLENSLPPARRMSGLSMLLCYEALTPPNYDQLAETCLTNAALSSLAIRSVTDGALIRRSYWQGGQCISRVEGSGPELDAEYARHLGSVVSH